MEKAETTAGQNGQTLNQYIEEEYPISDNMCQAGAGPLN